MAQSISWPKRILIEDASSAVITGAGNETMDPDLAPSLDFPGDTFLISVRQLLSDLTLAFDRGFRNWILAESPDGVLERANPEDFFVRTGDTEGRRQLEAIKRWNHELRKPPIPERRVPGGGPSNTSIEAEAYAVSR